MSPKKVKTQKEIQKENLLKEMGQDLFAKKKYKKALPIYIELSQLNSGNLRIKTKVGDILHKLGRIKEACAVYRSVAAQYAHDGMLVQAIAVNKMILNINPKEKGLLKELAQLYSHQKKGHGSFSIEKTSTVVAPIQFRKKEPQSTPVAEPKKEPIPPAMVEPIFSSTDLPPELDPDLYANPKPSDLSSEAMVIDLTDDQILPVSFFPGKISKKPSLAPESIQEEMEIFIDFTPAVDLGEIAEISLPPTPLFSDLEPEALERTMDLLIRQDFDPGQNACVEGEFGESIFVICHGEMEVTAKDAGGDLVPLATLKEGDFFGEFAYFTDRKRHANVTAKTDCVVLEINGSTLEALISEFPKIEETLQKFYHTRFIDTLLAKSRIFSKLTKEQRLELAKKFELKKYAKGSFIMREGEMGDSMYLIQEGNLLVETVKKGKRVKLAVLKEGNFCGEFSILTNAKRTADVSCQTSAKLLRLSKEASLEFFKFHPKLHEALKKIAEQRVQSTIRTLSKKASKF